MLCKSSEIEDFKGCELVSVNINTREEIVLAGDCANYHEHTAVGDVLYYVSGSELLRVERDGSGRELVCHCENMTFPHATKDGKYPYWHVCASPDGRFLAADTQSGEFSGVCLINMENGMETMVAKAGYTWVHPSRPHPQFSPDGSFLIWNSIRDGKLGVEFVKIKDIL